ncbi:hypothetical protein B0H17DRAFT_1136502 [Mycena rosella]|uniref:Uncharacterized protein n=1 Tax=Mycena rosella TaxID=1033263 RepID=A0AAD7DAV8_MYCRO|nr:hypothetical protein B0H17DRAFT_1136502 [Mycena rosella]
MSANPRHYNIADRTNFENYADALRQFGAGLGPFPGNPPVGYRESFRLGHKYAPVPEDYPHLFTKDTEVPRTAAADISMSAAALGTILEAQHKMTHSVISISQLTHGENKHDNRPAYFNGGNGRFHRGRGFGGRGGGFGGRGAFGGRSLVGQNNSNIVGTPALTQSADRVDAGHVGGRRGRSRRYRQTRNNRHDDITSDVATAGGLTDNESEFDEVTPEEVPSELEEGEDNGFNANLNMN